MICFRRHGPHGRWPLHCVGEVSHGARRREEGSAPGQPQNYHAYLGLPCSARVTGRRRPDGSSVVFRYCRRAFRGSRRVCIGMLGRWRWLALLGDNDEHVACRALSELSTRYVSLDVRRRGCAMQMRSFRPGPSRAPFLGACRGDAEAEMKLVCGEWTGRPHLSYTALPSRLPRSSIPSNPKRAACFSEIWAESGASDDASPFVS